MQGGISADEDSASICALLKIIYEKRTKNELLGTYLDHKIKITMTKGEQTKQYIIEKAAAVFNIKGIDAASMSDIMQATGLSKGTLYVHFENKSELAAAAVEYSMQAMELKISAAVNKAQTAEEKLYAFTEVTADALNPSIAGGCPIINIGPQADDTNPVVNIIIKNGLDRIQELISDLVNLGISRGEFRTDWDGKEFAVIMFAMIEGAVMMAKVDRNSSKTEIAAKRIKQMITGEML